MLAQLLKITHSAPVVQDFVTSLSLLHSGHDTCYGFPDLSKLYLYLIKFYSLIQLHLHIQTVLLIRKGLKKRDFSTSLWYLNSPDV